MRRRVQQDDSGVIAVLTALLVITVLLPLVGLGLTAYVRSGVSAEMQRAADAGALAASTSLLFVDLSAEDLRTDGAKLSAGPACTVALNSLGDDVAPLSRSFATAPPAPPTAAPTLPLGVVASIAPPQVSPRADCVPSASTDEAYPQCIDHLVENAQVAVDTLTDRLLQVKAAVQAIVGAPATVLDPLVGAVGGTVGGVLGGGVLGGGLLTGQALGPVLPLPTATTSAVPSPTAAAVVSLPTLLPSAGASSPAPISGVVSALPSPTTIAVPVLTASPTPSATPSPTPTPTPSASASPTPTTLTGALDAALLADLQTLTDQRLRLAQRVFALIPAAQFDGISVALSYEVSSPLDGFMGRTGGSVQTTRSTSRRLFKALLPTVPRLEQELQGHVAATDPRLPALLASTDGPDGKPLVSAAQAQVVGMLQDVLVDVEQSLLAVGQLGEQADDGVQALSAYVTAQASALSSSLAAAGVPAALLAPLTAPLPIMRVNPINPECQVAAVELVKALSRALELNHDEQDLTACLTEQVLGVPATGTVTAASCVARLFRAQLRPDPTGSTP